MAAVYSANHSNDIASAMINCFYLWDLFIGVCKLYICSQIVGGSELMRLQTQQGNRVPRALVGGPGACFLKNLEFLEPQKAY